MLGGYALLYPRSRVITLVSSHHLHDHRAARAAWLGRGSSCSCCLPISEPIGDGGGGVAYFAHIGGFLFGMLLIKLFADNVHENYDAPHRMPVY